MKNNISNDKVLVALAIVFLVALIGTNLDKVTGNILITQDKDTPIVTVSPNPIKAGYKVDVQVQVRDACVHPEIEFFFGGKRYDGTTTSSGGRKAEVTKKGRYKFCQDDYELEDNSFTVSYRTKPDWDGDYYARVYYWKDRNTKDYIHSYFKVIPK